ncbi:PREDICTED: eukaryotic translation initiation factor 3 subunit I isoform X2 [Eufriesea mexicana]|uniref:eukaryotic translation initiation factor 3 subunit I isoform X2 n=1 Tax=Eufriesea mexicana TaxID=516756 RepID=UPI00083C1C03|nr:PREDICTED: eukaryotic translation initiation factor 3 subunit I isoform X2 [Eufriesea mexicana]
MKPLMLQGHERPITKIKYNREGDLLFSSSKDKNPNVWYSLNGERLGTFNGHMGSVWCIDVNWDTTRFLSGSGDNTLRIWDCQTGGPRISAILWGALDETVITGHEDGEIIIWDVKTRQKLKSAKCHKSQINDMQFNKDGTMFVTASKDNTAKLFDSDSLTLLKTYKTERPVNSATISPTFDHVVLGGGQDAMDVTTTSTRQGKFDSRFFHLVFEEEFARLKGHFGPINSLAFHPNGRSFSTGGEDGYVRINTFDQSYFDFHFEY